MADFNRLIPMLVAAGLATTQQEEIEEVFYTATDMAYVAVAQLELSGINTIVTSKAAADELPADLELTFASFLRDEMSVQVGSGDPSEDPWGDPYRLQVTNEGWKIASRGPDGEFDTADDLVTIVKAR